MTYHRIQDNQITATFPGHPKSVYLHDLDEHIERTDYEQHGIYQETDEQPTLTETQYISGYDEVTVIDGRPVRPAIVADKTPEQLEAEIAAWREGTSIRMAAARIVITLSGKLADVEAFIAALPEPDKTYASVQWEYEVNIRRNHRFVLGMIQAGLFTATEMDELFKQAASIE